MDAFIWDEIAIDRDEYIKKIARATCCPNAICNGHASRPEVAPVCKCGRKCATCGRYKWILFPHLPKPPEGYMKHWRDVEKLNWVDNNETQIALFPQSFWNLWKTDKETLTTEPEQYHPTKLGNTWVLVRKKIKYGYIGERKE